MTDMSQLHEPDYREAGRTFSKEFILGTATASYQIEGAIDEGGRKPSIWDTFANTPGKVVNGDTGAVACDHYHRWESDLDLLADLGVDAYRFSVAWPRVIPDGVGQVNAEGLDFYSRLVDGLRERGITPYVTLYHWDLPQVLQDAGGWTVRETAEAYRDYAKVVVEHLGERVGQYTTLNEPWCSAYLGYAAGIHAPGVQDAEAAFKAIHHLNLAHGYGVQTVRESLGDRVQTSVTHNFTMARPADPNNRADVALANREWDLANGVWIGPEIKGAYPEQVFEATARFTDWSFIKDGDLEQIHQPIDVLGVNYYTPLWVRERTDAAPSLEQSGAEESATEAWVPSESPGMEDAEFVRPDGWDTTEMDWIVDPTGLEEILVRLSRETGLPLVVTENGRAVDDVVEVDESGAKVVHDAARTDYLLRHFTAASRAMEQGVDLRGYFVWSLMDNYEWAEGYTKRFGIYHVDYDTQERVAKDSAKWLTQFARTRVLPPVE